MADVYVISIKDDRRNKAKQQFRTIQHLVRSWSGVHGGHLDLKQLISQNVLQHNHTLRRGEIGCFLSHKQIWEQVTRPTLILEDDATLPVNWLTCGLISEALVALKGQRWDMLLLARNPRRMKTLRSNVKPPLVRPKFWCGLFAYIVSPEGARKMLTLPQVQSLSSVAVDTVLSHAGVPGDILIFALKTNLCSFHRWGSDTREIQ